MRRKRRHGKTLDWRAARAGAVVLVVAGLASVMAAGPASAGLAQTRGAGGRDTVSPAPSGAGPDSAPRGAAGTPPAAESRPSDPRPLTIAEVVRFSRFSSRAPVAVSPDGEWVAYVTIDPGRSAWPDPERPFTATGVFAETVGSELHIARTRAGAARRLAPDSAHAWAPSWSPDGRRLAFYSDGDGAVRLWLWDRETDRVRRASDEVVWTIWGWETPRWTPDGESVVVKLLPAGHDLSDILRLAAAEPPRAERAVNGSSVRILRSGAPAAAAAGGPEADTGSAPAWLRWRYGGDLAVVDVESGAVRRLTSGLVPAWWAVSPDGARLAFTRQAEVDAARGRVAFRLGVVPLDGRPHRDLPGPIRQTWGTAVSWSPDGRRLAYISAGGGDDGGLFVVDADAGTRRRLGAARAGWADPHRGPVWSADGKALCFTTGDAFWTVDVGTGRTRRVAAVPGRTLLGILSARGTWTPWSPGGRSVVVRARDGRAGTAGFVRVDPDAGTVEELVSEEGVYAGAFGIDVAARGRTAVVRFSNGRRPPDLWAAGADLRRSRRVTTLNPGLEPRRLGRSRRIEWTTTAGERLHGALLLPPGYDEESRLPLIVDVYGGRSGSREATVFDRHRQLLATRGYAVLSPDVPLEVGTPLRDHARAVLPGVDRAIELGIADPERVGVMGHSYGGYGTLALLVQTDRFSAAVASAAHADMIGMFATLRADGTTNAAWAEHGQGRMGGTPWEVRDRYIENSPFFRLDRVRTPLLLLHGMEDRNTPVGLAREVFAGLNRLGRDAVLATYAGEGHWPGSWSVANRMDYWRRVVAWFDRYLAAPDRPS